MAAEVVRVFVPGAREELPVTHGARSHVHVQPPPRTAQWQATLAHSRSPSYTHFVAPAHAQPQRYGCRLTHGLSAMSRGERAAQGSAGKLGKPSEPLFPKTSQQVRETVCSSASAGASGVV